MAYGPVNTNSPSPLSKKMAKTHSASTASMTWVGLSDLIRNVSPSSSPLSPSIPTVAAPFSSPRGVAVKLPSELVAESFFSSSSVRHAATFAAVTGVPSENFTSGFNVTSHSRSDTFLTDAPTWGTTSSLRSTVKSFWATPCEVNAQPALPSVGSVERARKV